MDSGGPCTTGAHVFNNSAEVIIDNGRGARRKYFKIPIGQSESWKTQQEAKKAKDLAAQKRNFSLKARCDNFSDYEFEKNKLYMLQTSNGRQLMCLNGYIYRLEGKSAIRSIYRWQCILSGDGNCRKCIYTECMANERHLLKAQSSKGAHLHEPYSSCKLTKLMHKNDIRSITEHEQDGGGDDGEDEADEATQPITIHDNPVALKGIPFVEGSGMELQQLSALSKETRRRSPRKDAVQLTDPLAAVGGFIKESTTDSNRFYFLPSSKGRRVLVFDNFLYHFNFESSSNGHSYWTCTLKRKPAVVCRAHVITATIENVTTLVNVSGEHLHGSCEEEIAKRIRRQLQKEKQEKESGSRPKRLKAREESDNMEKSLEERLKDLRKQMKKDIARECQQRPLLAREKEDAGDASSETSSSSILSSLESIGDDLDDMLEEQILPCSLDELRRPVEVEVMSEGSEHHDDVFLTDSEDPDWKQSRVGDKEARIDAKLVRTDTRQVRNNSRQARKDTRHAITDSRQARKDTRHAITDSRQARKDTRLARILNREARSHPKEAKSHLKQARIVPKQTRSHTKEANTPSKPIKAKEGPSKSPSPVAKDTILDVASQMDLTKVSKMRSAKGGDLLCIDGYIYHMKGSANGRNYWLCIKSKDATLKCKSRVATISWRDEDEDSIRVIRVSNAHTHAVNEMDIKRRLYNTIVQSSPHLVGGKLNAGSVIEKSFAQLSHEYGGVLNDSLNGIRLHAANTETQPNRRTMKLYAVSDGPPSLAVRMTLKALKLPYELMNVDYINSEHLSDEYAKLNPQKEIPVLDDDGFCLSESIAIMQYLCDKYAATTQYYPKEATQRAVVNQRLCFNMGFYYASISAHVMAPIFFDYKRSDMSLKKVKNALDVFETYLKRSATKYAASNTVTIADFALVSATLCLEAIGFNLAPWPLVNKWYATFKKEFPDLWQIADGGMQEIRHFEKNPPDLSHMNHPFHPTRKVAK